MSSFTRDQIKKLKDHKILSDGNYKYWAVLVNERWRLRSKKILTGEAKPPSKRRVMRPKPIENDEMKEFLMNSRTGYSHLKHQLPEPDINEDESDAEAEDWDNYLKASMEQAMDKSKKQLDDDAENKVLARSDSELRAGAKKTQIKKKLMKLLELNRKK